MKTQDQNTHVNQLNVHICNRYVFQKIMSVSDYEEKMRKDVRQQSELAAKRVVDVENVLPKMRDTLVVGTLLLQPS
jgi:hypothetical protein